MYRFLRCFLCLLVVCCLILNLSPIKANATSGVLPAIASAAGVTVSAPVAIAAGLIALGIMAGTNDDFQRVVSNAVDSLGDWVKDGTVELIQTVDSAGKKAYYMASDMMEDLRSFTFNQNVVTSTAGVRTYLPEGSIYNGWRLAQDCVAIKYLYYYDTGSDYRGTFYHVVFSLKPDYQFVGDYQGDSAVTYNNHLYWYRNVYQEGFRCEYDKLASKAAETFPGVVYLNSKLADVFVGYGFSDYISSYSVSLGQVSSVPVDGTSAREWSEEYTNRGLYVDPAGDGDGNDEDGKWYWPLVLAPGVESLTQTDQWTGTTVDEFDDYETEEEYEIVGTPVVPFGSSVQLKPVTVPGVGDDTETDSGTTDDSADYTSWFDKIVGFLQNIWESIKELPSKFASWFEAIIDGIQALPGKFATWFETIIDGIQAIPDVISGWFTDVIEWLTSIWEAICSIPTLILDGITAIFVPSEDFVTTKVEALRERFSWIDPILSYGDFIKSQLVDPEPPVLYVHLGNAEGSYNYGGTVKFLDLTWYERYKSQGDAIISGFLWALFAWRMYVKLPGIINGVAGDVGHISYGESAWQKTEGRKERKDKGGKNK